MRRAPAAGTAVPNRGAAQPRPGEALRPPPPGPRLVAARRHQREDRAAEAAAGHPGAERPGLDGRRDGDVDLRPGHLEVVAQRRVRGGQQRPGPRPARPRRSSSAVASTRPFSVTTCRARRAAAGRSRRSSCGARPVMSRSDAHAERPRRVLAARGGGPRTRRRRARAGPRCRSPAGPGPAAAGSSGTGCADAAAAVEQQRVPGLAQQRGRLVHDPGRRADEVVLGPARERGQLRAAARSSPYSSVRASATAHSSAADEDSPAPSGQVAVDGDAGPADRVARRRAAPRPRRPGRRPSRRPSRAPARQARPRGRSPRAWRGGQREHAVVARRGRRDGHPGADARTAARSPSL